MVRRGDRTSSRKPAGGGRRTGGRPPRQPTGGAAAEGRAGQGRARKGRTAGTPAAPADARGDLDALFRLPLAEFTAARNALATRLKKGGRADDAEAVKALPRPSLVAWAVNQLYWQHRDAFDRLLATGARFYDAQVAQLSGASADLRAALDARREALSDLSRLAADLLRQAGHAAGPDTMRRITTTLEALSSFGSAPQTPQAGRLTDEILPPGFEALAPLVSRIGGDPPRPEGSTRVLAFRQAPAVGDTPADPEAQRSSARAAAAAALDQAERDLHDARQAARQAEEALKLAAARVKETEKEKTAAEERLAQLTAAFEDARAEALRVAAQAEDAAQALDDAERARDEARRHVEHPEIDVSGV